MCFFNTFVTLCVSCLHKLNLRVVSTVSCSVFTFKNLFWCGTSSVIYHFEESLSMSMIGKTVHVAASEKDCVLS